MKYTLMAFVFAVSFSALAQSTGTPSGAGAAATTGNQTGQKTSGDVQTEDCEGQVSNASGTPVKVVTPAATETGGATTTPVKPQ